MFLASEFFQKVWNFIVEQGSKLISTAIIALIAFVIMFIIKTIVKRYTKKQQGKRKHAVTLAKMLVSVSRYFIVIVAIIIILGTWGVNVTPILAGAGIVTLAISFGAQKLIADLISGICIVFENYYDVDDVVEINGFKGTVTEIGLKSTKLINWKNEVKIIANGDITNVVNFSKAPSVGVVDVSIAYKEDIEKVIALLDEKLINIKDQFEQIIEGPNVVGVTDLGDSGVSIRVTVKTLSEQHYSVERAIKKYIKELFEKENIEIPYQQIVIHDANCNN